MWRPNGTSALTDGCNSTTPRPERLPVPASAGGSASHGRHECEPRLSDVPGQSGGQSTLATTQLHPAREL